MLHDCHVMSLFKKMLIQLMILEAEVCGAVELKDGFIVINIELIELLFQNSSCKNSTL